MGCLYRSRSGRWPETFLEAHRRAAHRGAPPEFPVQSKKQPGRMLGRALQLRAVEALRENGGPKQNCETERRRGFGGDTQPNKGGEIRSGARWRWV